MISFARYNQDKSDHILCVLNFTPQTLYDYTVGLPTEKNYEVAFCSDNINFGGSGVNEQREYINVTEPFAQAEHHTKITLPPLAGLILQPIHSL